MINTNIQDNLQALLREEFGKRSIENTELPSYFSTALNPALRLRPYQEECFRYFLTYWENDFAEKEALPHLLFHMATGSGKTLIMAGLMLYLYEKGYRNFLFFVHMDNIIQKTKENFLNKASSKYLFAQQINIGEKRVDIKLVDNFQSSDPDCINFCLKTIDGLHSNLKNPKENTLTIDDFGMHDIVLISDEAHHTNTSTKKGEKVYKQQSMYDNSDFETEGWETTVMKIFRVAKSPDRNSLPNVLLEFTATSDMEDLNIAEKYQNKIIFDYPLKKFREDKYSKDIDVVQADLEPIERSLQAVILSQYKRKLFSSIGQDIKPVVMMKSKTISENKKNYEEFIFRIKELEVEDLIKIRQNAEDDLKDAFSFFEEKNIRLENLLLEIKEDFKVENLLLIDGKNISPEKQILLNTLEDKDNEYRVVFAVDMLNEGWDVLNLFDIVRLYETRDAKNGKPGKTTIQEAQLIGRGARYMPFTAPENDKPIGQRKYDNDITNRLRIVEKLHYHSSYNPRYIQELKTALVQTGIMPETRKDIHFKLKEEFKKTDLYKFGLVFANKREEYLINKDVFSFDKDILNKMFKVNLHTGLQKSNVIFGEGKQEETISNRYIAIQMKELGENVIRAALNRFSCYQFDQITKTFPNLNSIKEFIESDSYLSSINITIYTQKESLGLFTQREKLEVAVNVLKQIEPLLLKEAKAYKGSRLFEPRLIKDVFQDFVLSVSEDFEDKTDVILDISSYDWHVYSDCQGTSEEKYLIKYIESMYPRLKEKYQDVYLIRNEKKLKIYCFDTGNTFEPDYVLFLRKKGEGKTYDNIQIFIEPKGEHLIPKDRWKQDFLKKIKGNANVEYYTASDKYNIIGLPFFTESKRADFDKAFKDEIISTEM